MVSTRAFGAVGGATTGKKGQGMARGFLAGAFWGAVVSACVVGSASVLIPLPEDRSGPADVPLDPDLGSVVVADPTDAEPKAVELRAKGSDDYTRDVDPVDGSAGGEEARRPGAEAPVVAGAAAPRVDLEDAAEVAPQEAGDLVAAPRPDADTEEVDLVAPSADTEVDPPLVSGGAPRVGLVESPKLQAPEVDADLSISADPLQPQVPVIPAADPGLGGQDLAEAEDDTDTRNLPRVQGGEGVQGDDIDAQDLRAKVGKPAVRLVDAPDQGAGGLPVDASGKQSESKQRPLEEFAAPVASAAGKPRMAIILVDTGQGPLGAEAIEAFPFPVSVAVQADAPDAALRAAKYRARGFEVLSMIDIPQGATASDTEVAVSAALAAVPEVIGVLEGVATGLQGSRDVSAQVAQALLASGHGLVMLPNGLNTAQALAARDGVPSVTVFRDFDGAGQDNRVKRRFLDQAAFKARQDGHVVMLGRMSADTISALLLWGLQDRANSVALVPVSAVLLAPEPE